MFDFTLLLKFEEGLFEVALLFIIVKFQHYRSTFEVCSVSIVHNIDSIMQIFAFHIIAIYINVVAFVKVKTAVEKKGM